MNEETSLFGAEFDEPNFTRRRKLLPWWIKVFTWFFLVLAGLSIVCLVLAFLGISANMALYGLQTNQPLSITGLILLTVIWIKGVTALGLWMEKDWAIKAGIFDAILGIVSCIFMMAVYPFISGERNFTIRLELILLIPYLMKLTKIKADWERGAYRPAVKNEQ